MKKVLLIAMLVLGAFTAASAQKKAQIKFDTVSHDFGAFSESSPVVENTFPFTHTGNAPLLSKQAIASCGCTIPEYTKQPIAPGQKGTLKVTYNGKGKIPGHFKKTVTVRTNGDPELIRIYVEGDMKETK